MDRIAPFLSKLFKTSVLLFTLVGLFTDLVQAKDTIFWPYFDYPPLFIVENGGVSGYGIDVLNLIKEELTEYDHKLISAAPKRIFENMKFGKNYCAVGPSKTEEREEYLYYSLPFRAVFPDMVIMRKQNAVNMGLTKEASLKDLLLNKNLVMGHINATSSDSFADGIIKKYGGSTRKETLSGSDSIQNLVQMLHSKRIDWFIWDPASILFYEKRLETSKELTALSVIEQNIPVALGYITCPKNDWGQIIIKRVNRVLIQEIPTEQYFNFFTPWVHDNQMESFRSIFKKYLIDTKESPQ
ncbi:transporter substrate-binding domain-containing protein [bacterium]|nr:transporter substrate-binding domain-containing protein [bacterium]